MREDVDQDLIDEENRRKFDIRQERARTFAITRDPYYPPAWAAEEFDSEIDKEV